MLSLSKPTVNTDVSDSKSAIRPPILTKAALGPVELLQDGQLGHIPTSIRTEVDPEIGNYRQIGDRRSDVRMILKNPHWRYVAPSMIGHQQWRIVPAFFAFAI
jgi:hypothetical protein